MSGLASLTATEIRDKVESREVSCEEVTRAHLDRIAAVEPAVDAFLVVSADRALDRARRLDAALAAGSPAPALAGVPVAIKDVL
ncbi:MAG TPA: amidase family protein, partial [Vicinamibacteria bacterium]